MSPSQQTGFELWREAASFAARAHEGQQRKDGATPYFAHPARVALTVRDAFGCDDPVAIAAALLHDVIEDASVDYDDLLERFGAEVAACVAALTKDMRLPEVEREAAYDEALQRADWRARLVKLADTLDNLADLTKTGPLNKRLRACQRAMAIAQPLAAEHSEIAQAIEIVAQAADDAPRGA